MISGANEENLIIATARANIILKLNNTNEYKSWIILDNYIDKLEQENKQLKEQLQQKEDIIYKIKKCIEEKEEYYGDYMGDGNYTMYSMMGANNNRIPYIKSNLIKQILDNKGE